MVELIPEEDQVPEGGFVSRTKEDMKRMKRQLEEKKFRGQTPEQFKETVNTLREFGQLKQQLTFELIVETPDESLDKKKICIHKTGKKGKEKYIIETNCIGVSAERY